MQLPNARTGIGLKPEHFDEILTTRPDVGFFEVHAENYFVAGGPFHHYLERIRADYPLSIHGVGLSLGGEEPLDEEHLRRLARLNQRYQPYWFSEHLAWATHGGVFANDLLPLPYTRQTLQRVCEHVEKLQDTLGRGILLENPSTYVEFQSSSMSEGEFITQVVQRSGCGLLLDVNNVHVSCRNHERDPHAAIDAMPLDKVGEIHLAGFACERLDDGFDLYIDNHGAPVAQEVWELYAYALERTGAVATLIERDNNIPSLNKLLDEARRAEQLLAA